MSRAGRTRGGEMFRKNRSGNLVFGGGRDVTSPYLRTKMDGGFSVAAADREGSNNSPS